MGASHTEQFPPEPPIPEQASFEFDRKDAVIERAECFSGKRGFGKEKFFTKLTSIGEGRYVDNDGWIYERPIPRLQNGPGPRFVCTGERHNKEPDEHYFT